MEETSVTLRHLVDRFVLRRRAPTGEFLAGVRLARAGRSCLVEVTNDRLCAVVADPHPLDVTLYLDDRYGIAGRCACTSAPKDVCRHQVAAAHSLWSFRGGGPESA